MMAQWEFFFELRLRDDGRRKKRREEECICRRGWMIEKALILNGDERETLLCLKMTLLSFTI